LEGDKFLREKWVKCPLFVSRRKNVWLKKHENKDNGYVQNPLEES